MTDLPQGASDRESAPSSIDPGYSAVARYLRFTLSLPERAVRSGAAVAGGAIRESAMLLVPRAFQNSTTYSVLIRQMFDFLTENVGGVTPHAVDTPDAPVKVRNFVARKAVGNFIEMAGLATFHLSPLTLMAVVSDLAYGSQTYLRELAEDLKQQGVIDRNSTIDHVDDLLSAIAAASGSTAAAFDTPPLSVDGLRDMIAETRDTLRGVDPKNVIPQAEMARMWDDMRALAARDGVSPLQVSGAMTLYALGRMHTVARGALSGVRVAGRLLDRHVIDHYLEALGEIRRRGLYVLAREASVPYVEAVWRNFAVDKPTITDDLLSGKLVGRGWAAVRRWIGGDAPSDSAEK